MAVAKYTKLDDLKSWWDATTKAGNSRFILYHGQVLRGNGNSGAKTLQQDDSSMPVEEAWQLLSDFLTRTGSGDLTLMVKDRNKETGNRAFYGSRTGAIAGSGQYIGGVDEYISTKLQLADLERRLEEREPELSFWERVLPPEQIGELITGLLPLVQGFLSAKVQGGTVAQSESSNSDNTEIIDSLNRIAGALEPGEVKALAEMAENTPNLVNLIRKNA